MSKAEDLTGRRVGRLVVVGPADPPTHNKQRMWHCVCDCGNEKDIAAYSLKHSLTKSCGCLMEEARHRVKDLTGQRFGRLTVIEQDKNRTTKAVKWVCQCDCGKIVSVAGFNLQNGNSRSCGCLNSETVTKRNKERATHGDTKTPLYRSWANMKERCTNPAHSGYPYYGGRGIKVCEEWKDYTKFREWALSVGYDYDPKWTIDRIDPDGDYCPENCRFLTRQQQNATKRNAVRVEYNGETKCLREWAREYGIPYLTFYNRYKHGWEIEKALNTPVRSFRHKQQKEAS